MLPGSTSVYDEDISSKNLKSNEPPPDNFSKNRLPGFRCFLLFPRNPVVRKSVFHRTSSIPTASLGICRAHQRYDKRLPSPPSCFRQRHCLMSLWPPTMPSTRSSIIPTSVPGSFVGDSIMSLFLSSSYLNIFLLPRKKRAYLAGHVATYTRFSGGFSCVIKQSIKLDLRLVCFLVEKLIYYFIFLKSVNKSYWIIVLGLTFPVFLSCLFPTFSLLITPGVSTLSPYQRILTRCSIHIHVIGTQFNAK